MKNLKTFEGFNMGSYYDPPADDPLFEGVMDMVWEMFSDIDKIEGNDLEDYIDMLWSDHYDNILDLIYEYESKLSDDKGDYPWGEELRNEYTTKKYGREVYKKQKEMNFTYLKKEIAKDIYKDVKVLYPIEDFLVKKSAQKFNL